MLVFVVVSLVLMMLVLMLVFVLMMVVMMVMVAWKRGLANMLYWFFLKQLIEEVSGTVPEFRIVELDEFLGSGWAFFGGVSVHTCNVI